MKTGVLALQGDFTMHIRRLREMGVDCAEVRAPGDLAKVGALIMPGGESTVLLKLLGAPLRESIIERHAAGMPILATCAGLILLARDVSPAQESLAILDVAVERNAYGRQVDSFIDEDIRWTAHARKELGRIAGTPFEQECLQGVFIRAPRIRSIGEGVHVMAERRGEPVLVRQGNILAATFHPELTPRLHEVHQMFLASALAIPGDYGGQAHRF